MSILLEIRDISKSFAGKTVLDRIRLDVPAGSTTVLLGSSGSGKSTLIRIILGLIEPDAGEIHGARGEIGYVPQEGRLFPHLTAKANVELVAESRGWTRERIESRFAEATALVALEPSLLDRYPRELSGGQRQRVALLRAIFLDPSLLLFDEPLGALDPVVRSTIQKDLKQIFRRLGKTVLIVTHDLAEARHFGDEIVLLDEGRIVQRGSYEDLRLRPASNFVTEFFRGSGGIVE